MQRSALLNLTSNDLSDDILSALPDGFKYQQLLFFMVISRLRKPVRRGWFALRNSL
jgi:hypothetical protein